MKPYDQGGTYWLVNSKHTLDSFIREIPTIYDNGNKYVRFTWKAGRDRTTEQNSLAFQCYVDLHKALPDAYPTIDDARAYLKLKCGVQLMMAQDDDYRDKWLSLIKDRFNWEEKLELMTDPFDYPVTSQMTRETFGKWLDRLKQEFPQVQFRALDD